MFPQALLFLQCVALLALPPLQQTVGVPNCHNIGQLTRLSFPEHTLGLREADSPIGSLACHCRPRFQSWSHEDLESLTLGKSWASPTYTSSRTGVEVGACRTWWAEWRSDSRRSTQADNCPSAVSHFAGLRADTLGVAPHAGTLVYAQTATINSALGPATCQ